MRYIILCGGKYDNFHKPKQLLKVNGEVIVERTIRLLRENGITDIAVTSNNGDFDYLDVPVLRHLNSYEYIKGEKYGWWLDAFYPTDYPVCYLFGDVYFSDDAIKTIVETQTDDIEMFGSIPPFSNNYYKDWIESFGLKVVNTKHLSRAIEKTKELARQGKTWRKNPIIWELWTVIKDLPLQTTAGEYPYNYTKINDYTTDVDDIGDVIKLEEVLNNDSN